MKTLTVYFRPPEEFLNQLNEIAEDFEVVVCEERDELQSCLPRTEILGRILSSQAAFDLQNNRLLPWAQLAAERLYAEFRLQPCSVDRVDGLKLRPH